MASKVNMEFRETCIALDLETTGLRPESDGIIEIAAVKFQGDRVLGTWQSLVKPKAALPLRTQVITGIAREEIESAPPFSRLAGGLASFIGEHPIVGQSCHVDLSFLDRHGLKLSNTLYDTFDLASILLPELDEYSLSSIARHLGLRVGQEHRALPDALVSKGVFLALAERAFELDFAALSEIVRLSATTDWPLRYFFRAVERAKGRDAFSNSIGAQLAGKLAPEELSFESLVQRDTPPPLVERDDRRSVTPDDVESLFASDGALAVRIPGFEQRPEQIEMARAVASALSEDRHLIVEAGTGVGKSVGYLLPAMLFADRNSSRIVVSTNTINLQEQLIGKDIPALTTALDACCEGKVRSTVLKGRGNYLCLRRWNRFRRSERLSTDQVKVLCRLLVWLPRTASGDRSELNLMPGEQTVWAEICAQPDGCSPGRCGYQNRGGCFLQRARQKAESSHVVVVNHALLLSDIAASGQVLPEYDYLIVDEAHHLEDEATRQFGFEVDLHGLQDYFDSIAGGGSPGLVAGLPNRLRGSTVTAAVRQDVARLGGDLEGQVERGRARAQELFGAVTAFQRRFSSTAGEYDRRLRLTPGVRSQPGWSEVETACDNLTAVLATIDEALGKLYATIEPLGGHKIVDLEELLLDINSLAHRAHELCTRLTAIVLSPAEDGVYWVSVASSGGGTTLCAAPLHVGPLLQKALFNPKRSVVLTSATMSAAGTFDYVRERLGTTDAGELLLGSPFDYERSTLVYVAQDVPEPGQPGYQKAIEQCLLELCPAVGGRTLVLLTSHSAVRACHAAIRPTLERAGILVLGHGIDGSRRQLLNTFKRNPRTVLLGTTSFWEGIDVVGEALSVLVIAKLPFTVPTDPVFAARCELVENAFANYAVPQAILRFKQGFGRLIRSKDDRGVVVILDRRVVTKSYGKAFLGSLPPARRHVGPLRDLSPRAVDWLKHRDPAPD